MKLIGTELAKSDISAAAEAAKEFLGKIAGPAAEEVGLLLQDKVRIYRLGNQLKMLAKAQQMLNDAGVSPISVPLRTLLPLLEGAALEEEDDLSTKWAERGGTRESIMQVMGMSPEEFDLVTDNLIRLGLCSGQGMRLSFIDKKDQVFQLKDKGIISITQLGYEFVTACRQPPKKVT